MIAQASGGGFRGDGGGQIGEVLLQLVTQLDLHDGRDDGVQRATGRRSGSSPEHHREAGACAQRVDQVIQFVVDFPVFGDEPQAARSLDLRDPYSSMVS